MKTKARKKSVATRVKPSVVVTPPKDTPPTFGRRQMRQVELSTKPMQRTTSRAEQRSPLSNVISMLFKR